MKGLRTDLLFFQTICVHIEGWLFKTEFIQNITHFLKEQESEIVQHSWVT